MSQSSFGKKFVVTTWGESHGKAIGAVLDGCPAGLSLCEEDIQVFLDRRKPGQSRYTTARKEGDLVEILSGVFEGKTTGTPISLLIRNTDQRSRDYGNIAYSYRPGHADFTFDQKYGFRDYRGGGRSSGRETAGRVAAGAIAIKLLNDLALRLPPTQNPSVLWKSSLSQKKKSETMPSACQMPTRQKKHPPISNSVSTARTVQAVLLNAGSKMFLLVWVIRFLTSWMPLLLMRSCPSVL